ncbi:hypothetical protein IFT67_12445 [Sphingomonas sp. CFBP 13728]|uniref:hypothetical protein n=1 Tax=Sphingomonas sp. CFBP 13728 TaxID=2775294 RepID=UPI00177A9EE0|nr:hypothetical protein [Sphingomonas sp. CFBP 13728]MBD8619731.1 hypothetical protein [Sphingomonas sp. CFBP 13728]
MAVDYGDWAATGDEDASFDRAPFDHEGARKKMQSRIAQTMRQLNGEKVSAQGGKDFEPLHNNGVIYRPTLNNQPIKLPGVPEGGLRISRSKLQEKLPDFAKDVEAGHFDDQLEAALTFGATNKLGIPRKANSSTGGTRTVGTQSALNIGVAAKRRSKTPPSFEDIRKSYIDAGSDPAEVDIAIAKRKEAEGA